MRALLRRFLPVGLRDVLYRWQPSEIQRRRWIADTYGRHNKKLREDLFLTIANYAHINRPLVGYYFEFGSHGANTMRMAWDSFRHLFDWQFVAFDSFEGLPEIADIDKQEIWQKGRLRTGEDEFRDICRRHGIPDARLTTVPGFYADSLTAATTQRFAGGKAAVIYVDCDLYESAVTVLEFCRPFLQMGTVIVFDDWACFWGDPERGEKRAWREFQAKYPELHFEPFHSNGLQAAFLHVGA